MTNPTMTPLQRIDAKSFWRTLGERATGMTIVTADSDEGPTSFGLSASHVTASPATMLVSIDRKTTALAGVASRRHFAVNFLPASAGEAPMPSAERPVLLALPASSRGNGACWRRGCARGS